MKDSADISERKFKNRVHEEAIVFLSRVFTEIKILNLSFEDKKIDHLCYRVKTEDEYIYYKDCFGLLGSILAETLIGDRLISTFKLYYPIVYDVHQINIIELPSPKEGKTYHTGFEHAEFVVKESFKNIIARNTEIDFDCSGLVKKHNPELRLKLTPNVSIKLHHDSLENIIRLEKN